MAHGFLLLFLFSCIICTTNIHASNQTECTTLMAFARILSSPHVNWSSFVDCCRWNGITCNQEGSVIHLLLPSKGLKGGFVSSLANLTHLTHLNLSHNSLYGALETKLFLSMNRLEILDLSYNLLSGEIPFSLPLKIIQTIDLSSNHVHGAIPSSFFQQAWNLTSFNVSNNTFSGPIPSFICLWSSPSISALDFSSNEFSGNISRGFGGCSKLQILRAGHNTLSRSLPEDIYNASKLEELVLPLNSLNGAISERIANLTDLIILDLSFNHLSGVMPPNFRKLSKLKFMNFDENGFEGDLLPSLMNCTNLIKIHLTFNFLEGNLTTPNFSKLSHLSKLDLYGNNFTGILPISLYSCRSLKAIRLSDNPYLEGQIQPKIVSLKSLSFLSLGAVRLNNVTGAMKILMSCKSLHTLILRGSFDYEAMPTDDDMVDFHGFQNLCALNLASNGLIGQIPGWLSKLKNLQVLDLSSNQITGSIPSWLGTLPKLFGLDLSTNHISGELAKQLCRLPMLMVNASLVDNYEFELSVSGGRQQYPLFYKLSYFQRKIDLSLNNISGSIPIEIDQLQLLRELYLDGKNFSNDIPYQISDLKYLEVLNLSTNHMSGIIPSSITNLNFLRAFDVSYNNLEGQIPRGTQLQSFNASAFKGNPKLCGSPLPNECREIDADNENIVNQDADNELPWFYIFAALGFIVGFWRVCGSLVLKKTWRYSYFRFLNNVQDSLYVKMVVCTARMKRQVRD